MDLQTALMYATSIGAVVGIIFRLMPGVQNKLVPLIVFVANLLANSVLVINKFQEAAGITPVGTLYHHVQMASLWAFPAVKFLIGAVIAGAQLALQRLVHEYGWKAIVGKESAL